MNDRVELTVDTEDGIAVVRAAGDIDTETAPAFEALLRERLDTAPAMVVDLRQVDFFASAGLNALVLAHKRAAERTVPFVVVADGQIVLRPLMLLGLDLALTIRPTVESAVEAVASFE